MSKLITPDVARAIYQILQDECGALESWLENFVQAQSIGCREYRFQGELGFGGKFWDYDGRWYVNCYPDNSNPERKQMMRQANEKLAALRAATVEARFLEVEND